MGPESHDQFRHPASAFLASSYNVFTYRQYLLIFSVQTLKMAISVQMWHQRYSLLRAGSKILLGLYNICGRTTKPWLPGQQALRGEINFKRPIVDYFKMFYNDIGIYGNPTALDCAGAFFGAYHIVFGAYFPLGDNEHGERNYHYTIRAIEKGKSLKLTRRRYFKIM
jgi:hypothetical protein